MENENCLAGIQCPRCGNEDRLLIVTTVLADVTDGGADIADGSDMHWDDSSFTRCPECDRDGPLKEFRAAPHLPPGPDELNNRHGELLHVLNDQARTWNAAPALLQAAQCVLDRWESGDLAEAVRMLATAVAAAKAP